MRVVIALISCMMFSSCFAGTCQSGWIKFKTSCYFGYPFAMYTYAEAQTTCEGMRANLAVIDDAEENLFLKQYTQNIYHIWIGLSDVDVEGSWEWEDGSKVSYTNWNTGEPNDAGGIEDCAHFWSSLDGKWNDYPCTTRMGFVCERKSRDKD
ncbi:perlucin-like protein [Ptychodera flava]|uniref:perlucin-like protein n=1 Tax=Ptychodera flava TaxID=63121 RepID=UPI003969FBD8